MHELGLATAILDTAQEIAAGRPLVRVVVTAGSGQALSADSLAFGFAVAAACTGDADAVLEVRLAGGGTDVVIDEVEVGGESPEVLRREQPVSEVAT